MQSNRDRAQRLQSSPPCPRTSIWCGLLIAVFCFAAWGRIHPAEAQTPRNAGQVAPPALINPNSATLPEKVKRYVIRLMDHHDQDKDGALSREEWASMSGTPQVIDLDADGTITLSELTYHVADYGLNYEARILARYAALRSGGGATDSATDGQALAVFRPVSPPSIAVLGGASPSSESAEGDPDASDAESTGYSEIAVSEAVDQLLDSRDPWSRKYNLPPEQLQGLPAWFLMKDVDGDGQVTMLEFSPNVRMNELAQFGALDRNRDNLLTSDECRE